MVIKTRRCIFSTLLRQLPADTAFPGVNSFLAGSLILTIRHLIATESLFNEKLFEITLGDSQIEIAEIRNNCSELMLNWASALGMLE